MQDKQVLIAAHDRIRFGCQCEGKKFIVFRIAACERCFRCMGFFNYEQVRAAPKICNKSAALPAIEVAVELASIKHHSQFLQSRYADADIAGSKRLQQCPMRD